MKAVVAAFNPEKALVGAFSVITNLRMELFQALLSMYHVCLQFYIMYGLDIFCNSAKEVGGSPNKSKEEEAY